VSDLPAPDVLRARIEAERDRARHAQTLQSPHTVQFAVQVERQCVSASARLDRHGPDHWCYWPNRLDRWSHEGGRCPDYADLASEYPDPAA
jgi:hypothetical protein